MTYTSFRSLEGRTLRRVYQGEHWGNDAIFFEIEDDEIYAMYHSQECCESVYIESITGDLTDLVDSPILVATEETSVVGGYATDGREEWTFYKLATNRGWVDIRWNGRSNGYYSVGVNFVRV